MLYYNMKNLNTIILAFLAPILMLGQTGYEPNSLYVKFDNSGKQASVLGASNNGYLSLPLINEKLFENVELTQRGDSLLNELRNVRKVIFPGKVDIAKIASKLNQDKSIVYAERIPKAELLIGESDDPQLGSQYHLYITQIAESWENLTGDTVLVGVVDTGIDFEHEDLKNTYWVNPGESGFDENGDDKSTNLKDDDGNGYVDDWRGWDFGSESGQDNNPTYANDHGVHVAGIVAAEVNNGVGVAGVAPRVKVLNVKIGSDNGLDRSVYNQFEGLLYAGAMGCRVINCSWGSSGFSRTDADVVKLVNEMGSLIVAAAGNNGSDLKFFPAGYDGALSVASTADDDRKSGFSNYHASVGVSAPGSFVLATTPNNTYDYKSGTSMASPVAAGVAAVLVSEFPEYKAEQIRHLIMANADDISELNSGFDDKIGRGRVNLRKSLDRVNLKSVALDNYVIANLNGEESILPNDNISIDLQLRNVLDNLSNVDVIIEGDKFFPLELEKSSYDFEFIESGAEFTINDVKANIPEDVPNDYEYTMTLDVFSDAQLVNKLFVTFNVNQTYVTLKNGNISVTLNSNGNIGFNDFPNNLQGDGFALNSKNMLFEGGLMLTQKISTNDSIYVADVIRNSSGRKERDWVREKRIVKTEKDGIIYSEAKYTDNPEGISTASVNALGVSVEQRAYIVPEYPNSLILEYEITNNNDNDLDSVYAGLFFDWDISDGAADDIIYYLEDEAVGIAEVVGEENSPKVAVKLHSGQEQNFYPFNNDGADNSITVYSSFDDLAKRSAMTNGIERKTSLVRDASMYSGAGPFFIPSNKSVILQMSINAGMTKEEIIESANDIDKKIEDSSIFTSIESNDLISIDGLSPNPVFQNEEVSVIVNCNKQVDASYAIYDNRGRIVRELGNEILYKGYKMIKFDTAGLSSGMYHFGIICESKLVSIPFVVAN